jgi:hypothetical protein
MPYSALRFRRHDFAATAAQFLDVVQGAVELTELWAREGSSSARARPEVPQQSPITPGARRLFAHAARRPLSAYDERSSLLRPLAMAIDQVGRPPTRESARARRRSGSPGDPALSRLAPSTDR